MINDPFQVEVFAPATVANVAVGFDLLGFSLGTIGDEITVRRLASREVSIYEIGGTIAVPTDPRKNSATIGLFRLIDDLNIDFGFEVSIKKGIPLGSGMGGSAASAVGAIVGANALLSEPLEPNSLFKYALEGEAFVSGSRHADNISPCLLGGMTLVFSIDPIEIISLPIPTGLHCVLVHPHHRLDTRDSRGLLRKEISLSDHVLQSAKLAGFISACYRNDLELLSRSLRDLVIEPQRAHRIPGFKSVKETALENGALGCSISGSGPSVFALCRSKEKAQRICSKMINAFDRWGKVKSDAWVCPVQGDGARVIRTVGHQ